MHRVFARPENLASDQVMIQGEPARHMTQVLRMESGDPFIVVDPDGRQWLAQVEEAAGEQLTGRLVEEKCGSTEPPIRITLAVALLKGDKLDLVVQKATELGVCRIVPVLCDRCVKRIPPKRVVRRIERWQRIAHSAAAQSARCRVPEIEEPLSLSRALAGASPPLLMAYEGEEERGVGQLLAASAPPQLTLFTGPEGGFTADEVALARSWNVSTVGLGPRILRAETAALTMLALVMFQWGDLGRNAPG